MSGFVVVDVSVCLDLFVCSSLDTGAYGIDLGTNIAELLKACVSLLEDIEANTGKRIMLRLGELW